MDSNKRSETYNAIIAIVGPPNVGKSTLLNQILGRKVAIISPKPQTTRNRIMGIYHGDRYQLIFMDTPGIHRAWTPLHESMVESAKAALFEVDVVLLMIEMPNPHPPEIHMVLESIREAKKDVILLINKIDKGPKEQLLPIIDEYQKIFEFKEIIPISALKGSGIDRVMRCIKEYLKPGPLLFPKDMVTDKSQEFIISEIIREKIYLFTKQEVPYSCAVGIELIREIPEKDMLHINGTIYVEADSQKAILIGKNGKMIKKIGKSAREELEFLFQKRVYLELFVKVEKRWTKDPKALRKLGY